MRSIPFHEIEGVMVGHEQDYQAYTGVSVVLCPQGAVGGGGYPGGGSGNERNGSAEPGKPGGAGSRGLSCGRERFRP